MFTYNCSGDRQSNRPHGFKFQIVIEFAKCAIFQSSPTACSMVVKGVREEPDKTNFRGKWCTETVGILFCVDSIAAPLFEDNWDDK